MKYYAVNKNNEIFSQANQDTDPLSFEGSVISLDSPLSKDLKAEWGGKRYIVDANNNVRERTQARYYATNAEGDILGIAKQVLQPDEVLDPSLIEVGDNDVIQSAGGVILSADKYRDGLPIYHVNMGVIEKKPDVLDTVEKCNNAINEINLDIEKAIAEKYTVGYELKVSKEYMDWIVEGQPASDAREAAYNAMQAEIQAIKDTFTVKAEVESIKASL